MSKAGRFRGGVLAAVRGMFRLWSGAVLCSDQYLVCGLGDLVLSDGKGSGRNGHGESDKRG